MFKKMRGVKLPYVDQGYIYFVCRRYNKLPGALQARIKEACEGAANDYGEAQALFEHLTTGESVTALSLKHNVCEKRIYIMRKNFYEKVKIK